MKKSKWADWLVVIGFLGFLAFFRYFWVNPDELFLHTLRRSATAAYLIQCVTLAPFMLVFFVLDPQSNPVGPALAASFAVALVFFCLHHSWLEWKEMKEVA